MSLESWAHEVLTHYPAMLRGTLTSLGNHGGFSGARLWRLDTAGGSYCLKAWPADGPPLAWTASPDWKLDYCNIERLAPEEIRRRRAEFDDGKTQARRAREEAGITRSTAEDEIA